MPKAVEAIRTAPGVLAVQMNLEKGQATIGSRKGEPAPIVEMLTALESIGYQGEVVEPKP